MGRDLTDREIVAEVNDVARMMLGYIGTGYTAPPDHRFYEATDYRSQKAWAGAVEVYERITGTEVHDALLSVREGRDRYARRKRTPTGRRALAEGRDHG